MISILFLHAIRKATLTFSARGPTLADVQVGPRTERVNM